MITDYLAFDVETANSSKNSICALGVVRVRNRKIIRKSEYLICPPSLEFAPINTGVHGLCKEDVEHAPSIAEVWDSLVTEFSNLPVVAHNAHFDIAMLSASLEHYGIQSEFKEIHCTYQMTGKKLDLICNELGFPLSHHNALSDALACAMVFDHYMHKGLKGLSLIQVQKAKKNALGQRYHKKIRSEYLVPITSGGDVQSPFYGQKVVITGVFSNYERNEVASILQQKGADIDTSVSKKTSFLVAGRNMGPAKRKKAEDLGVKIIDENEFAKMIGDL